MIFIIEIGLIIIEGDCNVEWSVITAFAESVKWFSPTEEITDTEEFEVKVSGPKNAEKHTLIFGEVYPDDNGEYRVEISGGGETKSHTATLNGRKY